MPRFSIILLAAMISFVTPQLAVSACLTTLPDNPPFTPPAPYPTRVVNGFWYGTDALWMQLPISGEWASKRMGQKLFLWSLGYDWHKEPKPFIVVTGKRLDGEAPAVALAGGTNAFFGGQAAMLVGVDLPTEGCWEVTAYHGGHSLTFVVSVGP